MKVVLDACVLFPTVLRSLLIGLAARDGFTPVWSARILAEWQRAAARLGPEGAQIASHEIAALRRAWAAAETPPDPLTEARIALPDPADAHVVATAITAQAPLIVTLNLRDFPARALAADGLRAQGPDAFLIEHWLVQPTQIAEIARDVQRATERASRRPQPLRALLRRAKLPRLGKALDPG